MLYRIISLLYVCASFVLAQCPVGSVPNRQSRDLADRTHVIECIRRSDGLLVLPDFPGPLISTNYNFAPISRSTPMKGGAAFTLNVSPCPEGVNGTNTNHWLYLQDSTGVSEAVLITGGTCTSGKPVGTIVFTPANSHTGAWTIASATAGIQEASYVGSNVYVPAGTYTVSTISPPAAFNLECAGQKLTVLKPRADASSIFSFIGPDKVMMWDVSNCGFDGTDFADLNTVKGFSVLNNRYAGFYHVQSHASFRHLTFNNVYWAFYLDRADRISIQDITAYNNTTTYIGSSDPLSISFDTRVSGYHHNSIDSGPGSVSPWPAGTHGLIVVENAIGTIIDGFENGGAATNVYGIWIKGWVEAALVSNSTIVATAAGIKLDKVGSRAPTWTRISNTHIDSCLTIACIDLNGAALTQITGSMLSQTGLYKLPGVYIHNTAYGTTIGGNIFQAFVTHSIHAAAGTSQLGVFSNYFQNAIGATGIYLAAGTSRYSVTGNHWESTTAAVAIEDAAVDGYSEIRDNRLPDGTSRVEQTRTVQRYNWTNEGMEIGSLSMPGQNIYDHHTSGNNIDYDTRVLYAGGDGTIGSGSITVYASALTTVGQNVNTLATGTAPFVVASTTPVNNLTGQLLARNAAGIQQTNARSVYGTCTLGTNCVVTFAGASAWTAANSYVCTATDQTAAQPVKVVNTSNSVVTFTGTGTDVVAYACFGS